MSDDPKAIAGSEAYAGAGGGCTVWLDDNGSGYLYGMLNTSLYESCNAQLFRSDGVKVSLTARYGAERTTAIQTSVTRCGSASGRRATASTRGSARTSSDTERDAQGG